MLKKLTFILVIFFLYQINSLNAASSKRLVQLDTNFGKIIIELDQRAAPETTKNFLMYVKSGFYNGTIFHRVIKGFMIQGGGLKKGLVKKRTKAAIQNEADNRLKNYKYTIAMARTSDPHSATAQFFINTGNNNQLNFKDRSFRGWGYCVFGKVILGRKVVNTIESQLTSTSGRYSNVPVNPIVIKRARVIK